MLIFSLEISKIFKVFKLKKFSLREKLSLNLFLEMKEKLKDITKKKLKNNI
jgi:hypothetical protein